MSKCKHCGQTKGKRYCEALQGDICTLCCGQHRDREIRCPADCMYLAGQGRTTVEATPESFHKLWDAIENSLQQYRAGLAEAGQRFGEVDTDEGSEDMGRFVLYAFCSSFGGTGERLIEKFERDRGWSFPADVRVALAAVRDAWFSIFEVERVDPEEGLKLLDRLTGESVYVKEKMATRGRQKYDLMEIWVGPCAGRHVLVGTGTVLPQLYRHSVLPAAEAELKRLKKARPQANIRDLQRELVPVVNAATRAAVQAIRNPRLKTTDGEEMLFCKALFEVKDVAAAQAALNACPELEADNDCFVWTEERGADHPLENVVIGRIRFGGPGLELETHSRERLERGKAMIDRVLGNLVQHRSDVMQDPEVAMEHFKGAPRKGEAAPEGALPPEVIAQAMEQFMHRHMEHWLDDHIPALGGKTPRQAVRTKAGRKQVIDLLHGQENFTRSTPGGENYDFRWLYRELGLPVPE